MIEQLTIQLEKGGANPTPPLQYFIEPLDYETAKAFVECWHYSKRMPTGQNLCFGLRRNGELYAIIVYGLGVNPYQAQFLKVQRCVEIKRLCRREPKEKYPLSRFINLTTKMLKKRMAFQAIVAFADPEYNHRGTVYRAAGYQQYKGMTNAEWHLEDAKGERRHRRVAFRMARRNGISIDEARMQLGMKRVQTLPKYRWVRMVP